MTSLAPPPPTRTPSPKVRIRSHSFDSPSSRVSTTPIEESPFSKSASAIIPSHGDVFPVAQPFLRPLRTKISAGSLSSSPLSPSPSPSPSLPTSTTTSSPTPSTSSISNPHATSICPPPLDTTTTTTTDIQPPSPFLYQDPTYPMYSPWLVRIVLDLFDMGGLDWTGIAEPVQRVWGVVTSSGEVLAILSGNGRVGERRRWWD